MLQKQKQYHARATGQEFSLLITDNAEQIMSMFLFVFQKREIHSREILHFLEIRDVTCTVILSVFCHRVIIITIIASQSAFTSSKSTKKQRNDAGNLLKNNIKVTRMTSMTSL